MLVRPAIAREQLEVQRQAQQPAQTDPTPQPTLTDRRPSTSVEPPKQKQATHYHGSASLDPQRVNREMGIIVEEIIQRLTSLTGTEVDITLEISAHRSEGFDDATVRTFSENSRTLKFRSHGFEE